MRNPRPWPVLPADRIPPRPGASEEELERWRARWLRGTVFAPLHEGGYRDSAAPSGPETVTVTRRELEEIVAGAQRRLDGELLVVRVVCTIALVSVVVVAAVALARALEGS
jgi:hypothetical protein